MGGFSEKPGTEEIKASQSAMVAKTASFKEYVQASVIAGGLFFGGGAFIVAPLTNNNAGGLVFVSLALGLVFIGAGVLVTKLPSRKKRFTKEESWNWLKYCTGMKVKYFRGCQSVSSNSFKNFPDFGVPNSRLP